MDPIFNRRLRLATALLLGVLALNATVTFFNTRRLFTDAGLVAYTHTVLEALVEVGDRANRAEAMQKTYIITGDERFAEAMTEALAEARSAARRVRELTADNADQQGRMPGLVDRIDECERVLTRPMAARRQLGLAAATAIVQTGAERQTVNRLQEHSREMERHERELLVDRARFTDRAYAVAVLSGFLMALSAAGAVVAFIWMVTRQQRERGRAAAAVLEQRELLRATLASIGDGVIATDDAGRITFMNPVAESLTGWPADDARGQLLIEVFRIVNEESRNEVENPALRALAQGQIVGLANHTLLISRDGSERPIDDCAAPIQDARRAYTGAVLVFRDVTARRAAEQQINIARVYAENIVDSVGEPLLVLDADLRVVSAGRSFYQKFHLASEQTVGRPVDELGDGDWNAPALRTMLDGVLRTGEPFDDFEVAFQSPRIGRRTMLLDARKVFRPGNSSGLILLAIEDVTDRKRLEHELRQYVAELSDADRRKDEFLAMLAHELRNPLAPIRNAAQIIRIAAGDPHVVEQARTVIERQLANMIRLIDDLLDVSRVSRGKIALQLQPIQLAAAIAAAVEQAQPLIDAIGHELTLDVSADPMPLHADLARLTQIVGNLLTNAAKFTLPGGRIALAARRDGDEAVVAVRDSGVGMPTDMLTRVFELFTQVDTSLERTQGGLGIGLTLVKSLVEMHRGTVTAHSDGPGSGSEFVVRLPLSTALPATAPAAPPVANNAARLRVLVADDNADAAESLAMILRMTGHEVRTAGDGRTAAELAEIFHPDIILTDIGMPRMNGYELARLVRSRPWGSSVVLVALTGWGQAEDKSRAIEAGFDHHLVKPVDLDTLNRLLRTVKPA